MRDFSFFLCNGNVYHMHTDESNMNMKQVTAMPCKSNLLELIPSFVVTFCVQREELLLVL
jgi:hypothetical protein